MPTLDKRLTDTVAKELPIPGANYTIYWCPKTPGLGVRVSATGDRAYAAERRVDGKTVRRTWARPPAPPASPPTPLASCR